jgi:hypothetical protein
MCTNPRAMMAGVCTPKRVVLTNYVTAVFPMDSRLETNVNRMWTRVKTGRHA